MGITDILSLAWRTGAVPVRNADDEYRPGGCRGQQDEVNSGETDI